MMDSARLQAQVRALTRDVGALKEQLRSETKKRERLAVLAKEHEVEADSAQARARQLQYVNTKLEQELRTLRERAETTSAKGRSSLQDLQAKLAAVERAVHGRSVEAQRQVHRVHSLVQDVQAVVMPLAVAAAAAAPSAAAGRPGPALRAPGQPSAGAQKQKPSSSPENLHRGFSSILAGLSQLAALFSGEEPLVGSAAPNPAPLLLTAPDGSKAVRWRDENAVAAAAAASPSMSCGSGACSRPAGGCEGDQVLLRAEVQRLQAELAAARLRASATGGAGAGGSSTSKVQTAIASLEAVVPQWKATAQRLQSQVAMLKEKLASAARERVALQQETARWQEAAAKHEAAYAEAAAKLYAHEARASAASNEASSRSQELVGESQALRQRCSQLGAALRAARQEAAQLHAGLAAKEKLAAAQQATIRELEATIAEQQADIRAALDLVSTGGPAAGQGLGLGLGGASDPLLDEQDVLGDSYGRWQAPGCEFASGGGVPVQHAGDVATAAGYAPGGTGMYDSLGFQDEGWHCPAGAEAGDWSIPAARDGWLPPSAAAESPIAWPGGAGAGLWEGMGPRPKQQQQLRAAVLQSVESDIAGLEKELQAAINGL